MLLTFWLLDMHAARDFDALRVDPAEIVGQERSNDGSDILCDASTTQGRMICDCLVDLRIVAHDATTEIRGNGARCDDIGDDPTRSQLYGHVARQRLQLAAGKPPQASPLVKALVNTFGQFRHFRADVCLKRGCSARKRS